MNSVDVSGMMQEIKSIKSESVSAKMVGKLSDDVQALRLQLSELVAHIGKPVQATVTLSMEGSKQPKQPKSYAATLSDGADGGSLQSSLGDTTGTIWGPQGKPPTDLQDQLKVQDTRPITVYAQPKPLESDTGNKTPLSRVNGL